MSTKRSGLDGICGHNALLPLDRGLDGAANDIADAIVRDIEPDCASARASRTGRAAWRPLAHITLLLVAAFLPLLASCAPQEKTGYDPAAGITQDIDAGRDLGGPSSLAPGEKVGASDLGDAPWMND